MSPKTALVLGISGQTGAYLAKHLIEKSFSVVGTSRSSDEHTFWRLNNLGIRSRVAELVELQPSDFQAVSRVLQELTPDLVFYFAGQSSVSQSFTSPFETYQSIAASFLNVLEGVRRFSPESRVFNAVSSDCFGNQPHTVLNESSHMAPESPYGVAKAASYWQGIQYRNAYGLLVSNGIFSNHESPIRGNTFVSATMVRQLKEFASGKRSHLSLGDISVVRDWGWAPEYAEAAFQVATHETPGDYVIATGQSNPLEEFLRLLAIELRVDVDTLVVTKNERKARPNEISSVRLDPAKIRDELGWSAKYVLKDVARMLALGAHDDTD